MLIYIDDTFLFGTKHEVEANMVRPNNPFSTKSIQEGDAYSCHEPHDVLGCPAKQTLDVHGAFQDGMGLMARL